MAPLSPPAFVTTEGNKKTIQHLEGGIIKEILIREGQHVEAGKIILRLDDTSPKANLEIFRNQLYAAVARDARLAAELDGSPDVEFPDELTAVSNDPIAAKAIEDQSRSVQGATSIFGRPGINFALACGSASSRDRRPRSSTGANEEQINFIIDELTRRAWAL